MINEEFHSEVKALHQADCDMQKENLENLKNGEVSQDAFLEQQAIIGRMFKAGMEEVLQKSKAILNSPE